MHACAYLRRLVGIGVQRLPALAERQPEEEPAVAQEKQAGEGVLMGIRGVDGVVCVSCFFLGGRGRERKGSKWKQVPRPTHPSVSHSIILLSESINRSPTDLEGEAPLAALAPARPVLRRHRRIVRQHPVLLLRGRGGGGEANGDCRGGRRGGTRPCGEARLEEGRRLWCGVGVGGGLFGVGDRGWSREGRSG